MCILALYKFVRGRILIHFWLHVWNEPTSTRSFLMSNTRFFQTFWIIGLFSNFLFDTNLMSPYQLNHYIFTTSPTSKKVVENAKIRVFRLFNLELANYGVFLRSFPWLCQMSSISSEWEKRSYVTWNRWFKNSTWHVITNYENFFLSSVTLLLQTPIWAAN